MASNDADQDQPGAYEPEDMAKWIYAIRRRRSQISNAPIFADPAWDILLWCFARGGVNIAFDVAGISKELGFSPSTLGRWINILATEGLLENDRQGEAQPLLQLTARAKTALHKFLSTARCCN